MTHNDYTKLMLNIKDNNIYFYDKFKWNSKRTNKHSNGVFSVSIIKLVKYHKKYII